jgi:hypothetical protein
MPHHRKHAVCRRFNRRQREGIAKTPSTRSIDGVASTATLFVQSATSQPG